MIMMSIPLAICYGCGYVSPDLHLIHKTCPKCKVFRIERTIGQKQGYEEKKIIFTIKLKTGQETQISKDSLESFI